MAIYTVKNGRSNEQVIKAAKKAYQNARLQQEVRSRQKFTKKPKKRLVRKKALIREMYRLQRKREQFYA